MNFTPVDSIKVNGNIKVFNGYIYGLSYDVSLGNAPSKITLNVISEDGSYTPPELSVSTPYMIQAGAINENFYPISYQEQRSSGGNTLSVVFWDASIALDRVWVGLHKLMGHNPDAKMATNSITQFDDYSPNPYPKNIYEIPTNPGPTNLMIVGDEIHPCDTNEDGIFDNTDIKVITYDKQEDPCGLMCPNDNVETYSDIVNECIVKFKTEIFEVAYSFDDLITALRKHGFQFEDLPDLQEKAKYKTNHIGTVREVLQKWCEELGLVFLWQKEKIHFVDATKRPKIKVPDFDCMESMSHSSTLEGTVSRGTISTFNKKGEIKDKQCEIGTPISLRCFNLRDLYTDYYWPKYGAGDTGSDPDSPSAPITNSSDPDEEYVDDVFPNGVPIETFESSCVCSYYDERLRWLFILRDYYNLNTLNDAIKLKGKTLDRFGRLKILNVLDVDGKDGHSTEYGQIIDPAQGAFLPEELADFQKNKGFFVLALIDENRLHEQFSVEQNIATEFMGHHWFRGYQSPYYGEDPQISPDSQYFGADNAELKQMPFANFNHDNNSAVAQLGRQLKQKRTAPKADTAIDYQRKIYQAVGSMIYHNKTAAVWSPNKNDINYFTKVLTDMDNVLPRLVNVKPETLAALTSPLLKNKQITEAESKRLAVLALFPGEFGIRYNFVDNPFEDDPNYIPQRLVAREKFGLQSKRCVRYVLWGVNIFTPAAASVRFDHNDNPLIDTRVNTRDTHYNYRLPTDVGAPSFDVLVKFSRSPHIEIPKLESSFVSPANDGNVLKIEYNHTDISSSTVQLLNGMTQKCLPNLGNVKALHEFYHKHSTYSVTDPFDTYEISVPNLTVPSDLSIKTGLQSIRIKVDEKGVSADYSIGNSLFVPIAQNVIEKMLLNRIIALTAQQPFFSGAVPQIKKD